MKGKKVIFLFLALLLPVFVFVFLKLFGKNEFRVAPLFVTELPVVAEGCSAPALPYHIPDSVMQRLGLAPDTLALAPANPWNSTTLEWTTPRHPGHGNWIGEIPSVYRWPYDYSKPGAKDDFIPQTVPFSETPESNLPHENELIKLETSGGSGTIIVEGNKH